MFFKASLYLSLLIFTTGLSFKMWSWLKLNPSHDEEYSSFPKRLKSCINGLFLTIFSKKVIALFKAFILDVLLLRRTLKQSPFRWLTHTLMFYGFLILLFMHALEGVFFANVIEGYCSTLNPFLFLRNLAGAMILTGVGLALYRRLRPTEHIIKSSAMDVYTIAMLAFILISGFALEASKITSYKKFQEMVEDYGDISSQEELKSLESYWVNEFGVISPNATSPFSPALLQKGKDIHETSCAACHSSPKWAFISFSMARGMKPAAMFWDKIGGIELLWYLHFLGCFIALAYLPFSKFFHIITSPLTLLLNAVMDEEMSDPFNLITKQVVELDSCTHCGTCSSECIVAITYRTFGNSNILPSEKLISVRKFLWQKRLEAGQITSLQQGLFLCTNCYRCTVACPVGINLQDMWFNLREKILALGTPEFLILSPFSFFRGLKSQNLPEPQYKNPLKVVRDAVLNGRGPSHVGQENLVQGEAEKRFRRKLKESFRSKTFSYCYACTTCSSTCPVVLNYHEPPKVLGLVPHQIIHAAILGVSEIALHSQMLWNCLGCYTCQQNCPQGVKVADIIYELKNMVIEKTKS